MAVWAEYTQMAQYVGIGGVPARSWVISCQDVLTQLFQRRRGPWFDPRSVFSAIEAMRLRSWEARALGRAGRVLAFSAKDEDLLHTMGVKNVDVGYPDVSLGPATHSRPTDHPRIVFLGALNRRENVQGVQWFLTQVLPTIASEFSSTEVLVVGGGNAGLAQLGGSSRGAVRVTGYVKDLREVLSTAWLAVAPLQSGAGIKIKVLEYLASGLPVVATSIGAEGIPAGPSDGLFTADAADAYAATCLRLLRDPGLRNKLGTAARRWFMQSYLPMTLNRERVIGIIERLGDERG